ncbi:triose-phosphate isomerase [Caldilinea sp.]|jgi:triosephosphate isomerase|uniref:triose-phosphate isomerase n=1 Tax=Caldilinea sp. TaxID=2293560 RepID=UPI0021DBD578|nr:triose-phosphate isomerase [Caldilinea sp.]GIV70709.1 MAG: triosephosphate isomerase [Caldilinea sp.]
MRRPMMAGNWKMNKTIDEAVTLARAIREQVNDVANVDCVVCPPFIDIPAVSETLKGSNIAVGAQNMHWAESGAYTGEISAPMLKGLATYVIIGHSERRQYFAETDETVNKKAHSAVAAGLTPILCVGESLEQNERGETQAFVSGQVRAALAGFTADQVKQIIIAYEPIWAIGTGKAATAQQANDICGGVVRKTVGEMFGAEAAAAIRILYGGSTNEKNIGEIMAQPDIDGALIGGASLKVESYAAMVKITSGLY